MFTLRKCLRARVALMLACVLLASTVLSMDVLAAEPSVHADAMVEVEPSVSVLFSASYYAKNNPDVFASFGNDPISLWTHWKEYGIKEGRKYLSPILDVQEYRAANPDLNEAFGEKWEEYLWHYVNFGAKEIALGQRGSRGQRFTPLKYLQANPRIADIGDDLSAIDPTVLRSALLLAMQDYIDNGMPFGSWVPVQYTAGPAVVSSSNSSGTDVSWNGGSNDDDGNSNGGHDGNGNSGNSGGNGGGSVKPSPIPDPDDPPIVDPDPPVDPDDPDVPVTPVEHEHTLDSFDEYGHCWVEGCDYTLKDLQRDCRMDHSAIEVGHFCLVCGAEGTYDPTEEHTKESLHTKNSFDENGECMRGCGLTLEEFQQRCTEDHELHIGQVCPNCNYEGTIPYAKDECPKKENHEYGTQCVFCDYAGECLEDHSQIYTTGKCSVCGEAGTKICSVDHADLFQGTFCPECGAEGTKEPVVEDHPAGYTHSLADFVGGKCGICGMTVDDFQAACTSDEHETLKATGGTCSVCGKQIEKEEEPFVCPNADAHEELHEGVACGVEGCDYVGKASHTFEGGECTGCDATCTPETCPDKENHRDDAGYTCLTCGYSVPEEEPEPLHPEGYTHQSTDYINSICRVCGAKCPNWDNHETLTCGAKCPDCDYVDPVGHTYDEHGVCTRCGDRCTVDTCPNKAGHDDLPCGSTCEVCGSAMPDHIYVEDGGAWICTRCHEECSHAFYHGKCSHCGATCDENTCPNGGSHSNLANGEVCDTCGYVAVVTPVEHIHDWSAQDGTCAGEGECSGCPEAANHVNILTTEKCGICGAVGTKEEKPVYAYTPENCPGHQYGEDSLCIHCGVSKVGFGEGEEEIDIGTGDITSGETGWEDDEDEDPSVSGGAGGSGAGGNSGDEDGTDVPSDNMPDALPVDTVVVTEQRNDTEPDPEDDGEDETEGGGAPADEDGDGEEGNSEEPSEQST